MSKLLILLLITTIKTHKPANTLYYEILGLNHDATDEQIKQQHKTLSKKHHPDKGGNASLYSKIQRAYEVLSDRTKRSIYDVDGLEEVTRYEHAVENGYVERRYNRVQSKNIYLSVSLKEAYTGVEKNVAIVRKSLCNKCQGTGARGGEFKVCPHCQGRGMTIQTIRTGMGIMRMQSQCQHCGGKGKFPKSVCPVCRGKKLVSENKNFKVFIEKGVKDGHQILFEGEGDSIVEALPGHVVINIKVRSDPHFQRKGDDLYAKLNISFKEAVLGFSRTLKHLDNRSIEVNKNGVSQPGELIMIENEGMPKQDMPTEKGNLYVKVNFKLPQRINLEQKKILRKIFKQLIE